MKIRFVSLLALVMAFVLIMASCGVGKSQFETRKGKRKIKHFNSLQYD
ncbi:hypothetical protein SAMN05421823_109227 [Catalinimonas alkaloidigena]|uniref:Lipoprotein n=1 Tax=Catalinimonas alkaloidigena TaxID=1075417 RepID=A0A1G9PLG8_9BACT|nr:hypothetical protein [Catalinimonas alkaloidigena]SDL99351.1 hypothetical protein SAMN05421823_109227 [Catalinimonas alkaloidigena]